MNDDKKTPFRRIMKISLLAFSVIAALLFVLRSVYAISLFEGLTKEMQASGWVSAGVDSLMQPNEELTYEASYLFVKFGTVKLQIVGKTNYDNTPAYRVRAYIDSYSGIPFVNLHAVYEAVADAKTFFCLLSTNSQKEGDSWVFTSYRFDFAKKMIFIEQWKEGKLLKQFSIPLGKGYTDGLSFFYYLRAAVQNANGKETNLSVPIIVADSTRSSVVLTINEEREPCKVTAYNFPIDSYRMSGYINFKGFFGVTGDFVGWISTDSAAVPLKADVKVILGSIVVKLKEVKRNNWIPPRSKS